MSSVWKEKTHKSSKIAASKNFFPIVQDIDTTCFDEWVLVNVVTEQAHNQEVFQGMEGYLTDSVLLCFQKMHLKNCNFKRSYLKDEGESRVKIDILHKFT